MAWLAGGGAALLLFVFLFYQMYYAPKRTALAQIDALTKQVKLNKELLARAKDVEPRWQELQEIGVSSDSTKLASLITDRVQDLARGSQLEITNFKPPTAKPTPIAKTDFSEAKFLISADGTTTSLGRFLLAVESARLPMRVDSLRVHSKKDGIDDLSIDISLLALVYTPKEPAPAPGARSGSGSAAAGSSGHSSTTRPATRPSIVPSAQEKAAKIDDAAARLMQKHDAEMAATTAPATQNSSTGGNK